MADPVTYSSAEAIVTPAAQTYAVLKARFRALLPVMDAVANERKSIWREMVKREAAEVETLRIGYASKDRKAVLKEVVKNL